MGSVISMSYIEGKKPDVIPDPFSKPTFDKNYGFKAPRPERVSKISEQEMKALNMRKEERDYCAHIWKDYLVCFRDYKPFLGFCNPELHAYEHCQVEDYILRMKEFEREKRLRIRAAKKQQKAVS